MEFNSLIETILKKNFLVFKYFLKLLIFVYLLFFTKIIVDEFISSQPYISKNLFFIIMICIFSDIGGYVFGKTIKGKKLTKISPNKTYSGMIGSFILSILFGFVFGFYAALFCVGGYLLNVGMLAMQKQFDPLDAMVKGFQDMNMRIRTSKVPVVVATQGYVFGGGCEITMHCDAGVHAAESYIGLVEVGVGLLPGGGGTKEFALRAADAFSDGDVKVPTLINHFKTIATASVATSAVEAFGYNYLQKHRDEVCYNTPRNIGKAKAKVLQLAQGYVPPTAREDIEVLGRSGMSVLYSAINEFRLGEYMSDYDVEIARKIAHVICGGDLTAPQKVSEQYLLDIEREGFLSLLGNQKTLDRIQYLLMNNKPLRN